MAGRNKTTQHFFYMNESLIFKILLYAHGLVNGKEEATV